MEKVRRWVAAPLLAATFLLSGGVPFHAALAAPGDDVTGLELRRQREEAERERIRQQMEEDRRKREEGVKDETKPSAEPTESETKFLLNGVTVDESKILPVEKIREITESYIGKEVTITDLSTIVEKINKLYAAGGWVTCKAFLPPQTIEDGVVRIGLLEGTAGDVKLSGNKNTKESYVRHRLPIREGEIPNLTRMNESLSRFNATNNAPLQITMKAGKEPGTTDFEIVVREPPKNDTVTFFVDNSGNSNTGDWREGLYYTMRSLSGRRDSLSLSYTHAKGLNSVGISYSSPVGRAGARMIFDYSTSASEIIDPALRFFNAHGHGWYAGLACSQPLITNRTTRTEAKLGFYTQSSTTDLLGGAVHWLDTLANNLYASFEMTSYGDTSVFYHRHYYGVGHANSYTGPIQDDYLGKNYGLYRMNSFWQKSWGNGSSLSGRLDLQWSSTPNLPSAEQFFLGGIYSVRGYKQDYIGGDNGLSFGLEYAVPVDKNRTTSVYGFFDYGTLLGNTIYPDHVLASAGLGIRANLRRGADSDQRLFLNLAVGFPLKRELNGENINKTRFHFAMNMQF